ncbi:hypothetical protein GGX14DRAFT_422047 [Mycena pura]|uniref:Uncharacterized protein n=1 Tax=Mycena pura TaxID=153505 RepID=A0AAD7E3K4_9AGAR|nr:hypothetical protein GGX14DRAFT_422047 [Mycena pura]
MAAVSLARAYQSSFDSHPHKTLAVAGGCLNALGDVVAQITQNIASAILQGLCSCNSFAYQTRKPHDERVAFDPVRTLRFFVFGASISPLLGRWNSFLECQFPLRARGIGHGKVSLKALSKRVAADQTIVAFIGSMGMLEGRNRKQIAQKYSDLFVPTLVTNWSVWPLLQIVNFRFMPLPYRVPFQSTCGVFWTLYLSLVNSREDRKQDRETAMRRTLG